MLTVKLICVGTLKEKYWRDACAEYAKRLSTLCKFHFVEIPEARAAESPAMTQRSLQQEGAAIAAAAAGAEVFPLCIEGEALSSEKLSGLLSDCALGGKSTVAFVIGSSHGLSEGVKALGRGISMSAMTFPHQLARVMLCEQIYRAFQIERGTRYHK